MLERIAHTKKEHDVDLTVPVDKGKFEVSEQKCFGKLWDMRTKECPKCADNELCAILTKDRIDADASKVEDKTEAVFLDKADFAALTDKVVLEFVKERERTSRELLEFVMETANVSDVPACVEWIKRFVRDRKLIKITDGIVCLRN